MYKLLVVLILKNSPKTTLHDSPTPKVSVKRFHDNDCTWYFPYFINVSVDTAQYGWLQHSFVTLQKFQITSNKLLHIMQQWLIWILNPFKLNKRWDFVCVDWVFDGVGCGVWRVFVSVFFLGFDFWVPV